MESEKEFSQDTKKKRGDKKNRKIGEQKSKRVVGQELSGEFLRGTNGQTGGYKE